MMERNQQLSGCWWRVTLMVAVCAGLATAEAAPSPARSSSVQAETTIGIEGVYYLRHASENIVARPVDERSPIVLRVASVVRDGSTFLYEIRYIGTLPGQHDLRDYLLHADGRPLASQPPLIIAINATLPDDHDGSLDSLGFTATPTAWPYRAAALGAIALWLIVTTVIVLRRWLQRKPRTAVALQSPPSLADRLLPLVELAISGRLSAEQQGRLEMLLLGHWRKALELEEYTPHEALRKLRSDPQAGQLLRSLEAWLHQPPGAQTVDVATLLAPYRAAAPISLVDPVSVAARA